MERNKRSRKKEMCQCYWPYNAFWLGYNTSLSYIFIFGRKYLNVQCKYIEFGFSSLQKKKKK